MTGHTHYCRLLLEEIEAGNGRSQRSLAKQLGIALGLTNLLLKQILRKGWIRVVQVKPNRVAYLITPAGMAEKAQLSRDYLVFSARYYASARDRLLEVLHAVAREWQAPQPCRVVFFGASEIAEIGFVCLQSTNLSLVGVIDDRRTAPFFGLPIQGPEDLQGSRLAGVAFDRLIVMALDGLGEVERRLDEAAVPEETVFWLRDWRWSNTVVAQQHIGSSRGVDTPMGATMSERSIGRSRAPRSQAR